MSTVKIRRTRISKKELKSRFIYTSDTWSWWRKDADLLIYQETSLPVECDRRGNIVLKRTVVVDND